MADSGPYGITGGIVEYMYPGDVRSFTVDSSASTTVLGGNMVFIFDDFKVKQTSAATNANAGVALHDAAPGELVTVARTGIYFLKAANTIAAGELVEAAAAGAIDVWTTSETTTQGYIVGMALEDIAQNAVGRVELRLG